MIELNKTMNGVYLKIGVNLIFYAFFLQLTTLYAAGEFTDKVSAIDESYHLVWQITALVVVILLFVMYRYYIMRKYNDKLQKHLNIINQNILMSSTDKDGIITDVSDALCELSGYKKEDLIGKKHNIFKHPDINDSVYDELWETITSGKIWYSEIKNKKKDGTDYWASVIITPIFNKNGNIEGYNAIRQDISDKKQAQKLSVTDPLTQTYNRLQLENSFKVEIYRAKRYNNIFSVILLDIDNFKDVNDTYGHNVGDNVLKGIAEIIKQNIRDTDILGRWGGEEFLIICHEVSAQKAEIIAQKLRASIQKHTFESAGTVTCSFGVAQYKADDKNSTELVKRADDALYKAKESGRNKVVVSGE